MTDNLVDQSPATALVSDAPSTETELATTEDAVPEGEEAPEAPKSDDDVPFPKKAVNALSRRDRQIGKLRAEQQQLQAELARLRSLAETPQRSNATPSDYPNEDKFDNYGDYLKAVARYEARQELAEGNRKQQEQHQSFQEKQWYDQRIEYVTSKYEEAAATIPDLHQTLSEFADIVDSFPPQLERLFLEAENPQFAFYALAKEGKLESLLQMSHAQAAMEIGRAEDRGRALSQRKQITRAPAPIAAAKGMGTTGKTLDDLSPSELLKKLNIR